MTTPITLATKLYTNRDEVKAFLGGDYGDCIRSGISTLDEAWKKSGKVHVLDCATALARSLDDDGFELEARIILAAAVEMLETSE